MSVQHEKQPYNANPKAGLLIHCDSFERLSRETDLVGYPVLPLISQLSEMCAPEIAKYIHWGATTQDIMDVASMLQIQSGLAIVERELGLQSC